MKKRYGIGFLLAVLHMAFFLATVFRILSGHEPDWPMYWLLWMVVDFPVSLLLVLAAILYGVSGLPARVFPELGSSPAQDVLNFIFPTLIFGVLGTLWYFFLPALTAKLFRKKG